MEKIKHGFAKDLELLKNDLVRAGARVDRYENAQSGIYQELWDALCYLSFAADRLWEAATRQNLDEFVRQLRNAREGVFRHRLLLEEQHLQELEQLFERFNIFYQGKEGLIELRRRQPHDKTSIQQIIAENERTKNEFSGLLVSIAKSFHKQLLS